MILVAGIPSEPPLQEALDALSDLRADVVVLNQRRAADIDLAYAVDPSGAVGFRSDPMAGRRRHHAGRPHDRARVDPPPLRLDAVAIARGDPGRRHDLDLHPGEDPMSIGGEVFR